DDDVPAKASEVVDGACGADGCDGQDERGPRRAEAARSRVADRVGEPLVWRADDLDCAVHVGPQRRKARQGVGVGRGRAARYRKSVSGEDSDGVAALRLRDDGHLPALDELVPAERKLVEAADDEAVARVEVGEATGGAQVEAVLQRDALRALRVVVD